MLMAGSRSHNAIPVTKALIMPGSHAPTASKESQKERPFSWWIVSWALLRTFLAQQKKKKILKPSNMSLLIGLGGSESRRFLKLYSTKSDFDDENSPAIGMASEKSCSCVSVQHCVAAKLFPCHKV